jgi:2-polyprenyl-3-methyl-5-hydroxy-6-metoxy-1,4-benzoquinol methylase
MDDELLKGERMYATSQQDMAPDHHYRYQYALQYIQKGDRVLDAACGCGYGVHYMASRSEASLVTGVDRSQHALDWANRYFAHPNAVYLKIDMSKPFVKKLPSLPYHVVTCFETVEHFQDDRALLRQLHQVLVPGGLLLVSVPNEEVIPHLDNPFYPNRVNPFHYRHYRPAELEKLLADSGFQILRRLTHDMQTQVIVPDRTDGFALVYVAAKT